MDKPISVLGKLDAVILRNIESSVVSIYKINKNHDLFQPILQKHPVLKESEYVIYPNINNNQSKIFLDSNGGELLTYNDGMSEFILLASGLYLSTNSPINNKDTSKTNSVSNYSW